MPVTKIKRSSVAQGAAGGPNWNSIRVDSDDDLVKVGVGASGTTEKTLVDTDSTQTLTNKTISFPATVTDSTFTIADNADATKILAFQLSGITTGTTRTLTIPDANDTIVGKATTDTLTNKTITAPVLSGSVTGTYTLAGTPTIAGATLTTATLTSPTVNTPVITAPNGATSTGVMITKMVTFTEDASSTTHTGTVAVPAGAWVHDIRVTTSVLWAGGTASMDVGDTADPNGYFDTINLKATDLLVNEVLSTHSSTLWGGQEGAYLVAASGSRGPTTTNFGQYYAAGSNILGVISVGTPGSTAGRTWMSVTYSVGAVIAAVAS